MAKALDSKFNFDYEPVNSPSKKASDETEDVNIVVQENQDTLTEDEVIFRDDVVVSEAENALKKKHELGCSTDDDVVVAEETVGFKKPEVGFYGFQETKPCTTPLINSDDMESSREILGTNNKWVLENSSLISENIDEVLENKETTLIDMSFTSEAIRFVNFDKSLNQETGDANKVKRPRRQGKRGKKGLGMNGPEARDGDVIFTHMNEAQDLYEKRGGGDKKVYLRKEMEMLRFVDVEGQRKKWFEVYCGLGPDVAREYDGLVECQQQHRKKKMVPQAILGKEHSQNVGNEIKNKIPLDPACGLSISDLDGNAIAERECSEDDESDEDYKSILRPAFYISGEPDFDSGPAEDGLEFLRRVRWEAARVPKVKVSKVDPSKIGEQTDYMPKIPDIAGCSEHLLPLKEWEDAFLADFSELRLALSRHEGSNSIISRNLESMSIFTDQECSSQLSESLVLENIDSLTSSGVTSCNSLDGSVLENSVNLCSFLPVDENDCSESHETYSPKSSVDGGSCYPTLSTILGMDSRAQISMLKKNISAVENMSALSRNDCAWIFALCAAIDTPLDADTSAALRSLLRKCANLRAEKSELDVEVIMLNILATISGRYFGQSEN